MKIFLFILGVSAGLAWKELIAPYPIKGRWVVRDSESQQVLAVQVGEFQKAPYRIKNLVDGRELESWEFVQVKEARNG